MKTNSNSKQDEPFWGMIVLCVGILGFVLCLIATPNKDKTNNIKEDNQYVFYNVPTYTTTYEIVYPDSVWRYTVVHHSPSELSSFRGTNYLHSKAHYGNLSDSNRPDYWINEWNNSELNIETTAPIRIVSETVSYKKTKYVIK